MRELRDLLASLQAEYPDITPPSVDETGSGCGNEMGTNTEMETTNRQRARKGAVSLPSGLFRMLFIG